MKKGRDKGTDRKEHGHLHPAGTYVGEERNSVEKALGWEWGGDMSQVFSPHCYEFLEQFQEL